jgi:iron(III) transport system ATP-binding protein
VNTTAIDATGLRCRAGGNVLLDGASLRVERGERIAICGPSGSGKTTLLRALAGLAPLEAGSIDLLGRRVATGRDSLIAPHERGVGMLFQDLALWPSVSVRHNVRLAAPRHAARVDALLAELGLTALARRHPASLSGGEQQRLALARVLIAEPAILLLDEPFTGLDLGVKRGVLRLLAAACAQRETTIVAVTHDPSEAALLGARRAAIMERGAIREELPLDASAAPASETGRAGMEALRATR